MVTLLSKATGTVRLFPQQAMVSKAPREVPPVIGADYDEAALVLPISQKASAALSRRCLQHVLRERLKVRHSDLAGEIQEVLDRNTLPHHIADALDAVRTVGNFAAHPIKSKVTGEITAVEPEEASWLLETLRQLFQHLYVAPVHAARKKAALNKKLHDSGKPALKEPPSDPAEDQGET